MADKISKEEFLEWCQNPITDQLYVYIADKVNQETWQLVETAGSSGSQDARSSGKILAFGEILNWKPETIMEEIDEVVVEEENKDDA